MMILALLVLALACQSSQSSEAKTQVETGRNVQKMAGHGLRGLAGKVRDHMTKTDGGSSVDDGEDDLGGLSRKAKSLAFYPFLVPPHMLPFGPAHGFFPGPGKDGDNPFANEWLSRTEPFKRNTALLDSPTYYIRLPPNPYAFVPGLGYVSRPPSLSDPEVYETSKPEPAGPAQTGNDLFHDPFYRLPINFVSNGKPTGVYQLTNDPQAPAKPVDSSFVNLNKGPYVFNGKPSEIFLVAQIYNALYGDELNHFYP